MQRLDVRTSASTGYKVYMKMTTDNDHAFKGTFHTDSVLSHIDPFDNGSSWDGVGAPTATAWVGPTGLTNVKPGWLALQTAGPTGNAAIGANWIGPVTNGGGTGGVDSNVGTSANVTYRFSVDAYQPADSYSGTMQYNVVTNY